jgi:hypothetical protein
MKPDEYGVMFSVGPGEVFATETKQDALINKWESVCKAIDRINQRAVKKYGKRLEPYFFPLSTTGNAPRLKFAYEHKLTPKPTSEFALAV